MQQEDKKKWMHWGGIVLVIIIVVVGAFLLINRNNKSPSQNEQPLQNQAPLPKVDSSVTVSLNPASGKREVVLAVDNIPGQTSTIDYELSYQTVSQGLQGVIGTIHLGSGESSYKKSITLGTCSTGTCIYHEVVGSISLSLKFSGGYGQKIFEKDFQI